MTVPLDDGDVPRITPGVLETVLDDQLVVLQTHTHVAQALNPSAAMVWAAIDGRRTVAQIIEQLEADTGVDRSALAQDARLALTQFLSLEIATKDRGALSSPAPDTTASGLLERSNRLLDEVDWTTVLGPFQMAATTTVVRTNNPSLGDELAVALGCLTLSDWPTGTTLSILDRGEGRRRRIRLYANGRRMLSLPSPAQVPEVLGRELNQIAAGRADGHVLLHAGAVERDGRVVVIAGDSGRGKSTLTAALVQRGFAYLTDEVVAVDVESLDVRSYAKRLDLSRSSMDLLGLEGDAADPSPAKKPVAPSLLGPTGEGGRVRAWWPCSPTPRPTPSRRHPTCPRRWQRSSICSCRSSHRARENRVPPRCAGRDRRVHARGPTPPPPPRRGLRADRGGLRCVVRPEPVCDAASLTPVGNRNRAMGPSAVAPACRIVMIL